MNNNIFLDSASTTPCSDEVIEEMMKCYQKIYGNPSSTHAIGREAMRLVDNARDVIAKSIGANPSLNEIYFTSSGTEANNMALFGMARANKSKGKHIISTKMEHQSVLDSLKRLEDEGFEITYLNADKNGKISVEELEKSIRDDTILVSIMMVNNEVGTITNLEELVNLVKTHENILFHTDAVASFGLIDIDVKKLNVDALSISAQKIYGPKGIGCLYIKHGVKFQPLIYGGNQENGKRAGTLNVPGIVGFAKATQEILKGEHKSKLKELKSVFIDNIKEISEYITLNGGENSVYTIQSITFKNINNDLMQTLLDLNGICCSKGSACTAGSTEPSHVLMGMGYSYEEANSTIRFSFNKYLTKEDIIKSVEVIKEIVLKQQ